jgi:malonyl-CoA decarboxylase
MSSRGEASGQARAHQILQGYRALPPAERPEFLRRLAAAFSPDVEVLEKAWSDYSSTRSPAALSGLMEAVEGQRKELFHRLNRAPGGTSALVALRADLLALSAHDPALSALDRDLVQLFKSWFNRGFLMMERIDWSSPADVLERIIRYEAVHEIQGWEDLRRRVQPADRRCYAFFHPSLVDEPLIFVEVALTDHTPHSIQEILAEGRSEFTAEKATTAVFYSISNCQPGLRGVSFGSFLIKQVVEELSRELPLLRTFVTLSPVPGFRAWLTRIAGGASSEGAEKLDLTPLALLEAPDWRQQPEAVARLRSLIVDLAVIYFLRAKDPSGQPLDPVARFHLGNGARLERINWLGDLSPKGLTEAAGLMVNYLYELRTIEDNHEAYSNRGVVRAAKEIRRRLHERAPPRGKPSGGADERAKTTSAGLVKSFFADRRAGT